MTATSIGAPPPASLTEGKGGAGAAARFVEARVRAEALARAASSLTSADAHVQACLLGALMTVTIAGAVAFGSTVIYFGVVAFVATILLSSLNNPVSAMCAFFAYVSMEGMFKYATNYSQAVYVLHPLMTIGITAALLLTGGLVGAKTPRVIYAGVLAVFLVWGTLQVLNPSGGGLTSGLSAFMVWYACPLLFFVIGSKSFKTAKHLEQLCYTIVVAGMVVSAFAMVQYLLGREWSLAHVPGYGNVGGAYWNAQTATGKVVGGWRPASTASIEGGGSWYSHLAITTGVALMLTRRVTPSQRNLILFSILLSALCIVISANRLPVLMVLGELLLLLLFATRSSQGLIRNLSIACAFLAVSLAALFVGQTLSKGVLGTRFQTILSNPVTLFQKNRGKSFLLLPDIIAHYPLGIGYQRGTEGGNVALRKIAAAQRSLEVVYDRETQWNALQWDLGFPGLFMVVGVLVAFVVRGWKVARKEVESARLHPLAVMFWVFVLTYFVGCCGAPLIQTGDHFWMIAAALFAAPRIDRAMRAAALAEKKKLASSNEARSDNDGDTDESADDTPKSLETTPPAFPAKPASTPVAIDWKARSQA